MAVGRSVVIERDILFPGDPGQEVPIQHVDQPLKLGQLRLGKPAERPVGEATHDQIRFAHAAVPSPEQQLATAQVQSIARTCCAGHRFLNAKRPDGPGSG